MKLIFFFTVTTTYVKREKQFNILKIFKVYKKRNQFFNILKVQHFKVSIPKFEPCFKKIGDSISPENCATLLSKMVFESRGQNVLMT